MLSEMSWQSDEVFGDCKKENIALISMKGRKGGLWDLLSCQPDICTWEDQGTDTRRIYADECGEPDGDSRQPAWLH